jgi:hypothetical protein
MDLSASIHLLGDAPGSVLTEHDVTLDEAHRLQQTVAGA